MFPKMLGEKYNKNIGNNPQSIHRFRQEKPGENITVNILEDSSSVSIIISHW
jgi:hypothetical protein